MTHDEFFAHARALDRSDEWEEFVRQWEGEIEKYEGEPMRTGQSLMNALYDFRPDLYDQTCSRMWDPFYRDKVLPEFIVNIYNLFVNQLMGGD